MGGLIQHASVQLMESSLELLGVIFPPPVLEQLVANAAKKSGQVDLAGVLRSHGAAQGAPPSPPAPSPGNGRAPHDGRSPALPAGIPMRLREELAAQAGGAVSARLPPAPATPSDGDTVERSPFAAAAAAAASAADTVGSSLAGTGGHVTPSPRAGGALPPGTAAVLLRQASHASSASAAAALLRHVSQSLDPLSQGSGEVPMTPHTLGDISGFEDLLEDDHRCSLERRPSMQAQRARSQPAPALDETIAAVAASLDEAAADGLPAAVQAAQAHGVEQAAAAAAAGQVSPQVRVPWRDKPLAHALSKGADASPLASPQKPLLRAAPAAASSWDSGHFASGTSSLGAGSLGAPSTEAATSSCLSGAFLADPAVPPASCSKDGGSSGSKQRRAGSAGSGGDSLLAGRPAQQRWDLSFCSASLEAQFRRWAAPYWVRSDASLGLVHWLVLATAVAKMVQQGPSGQGALLSLAGLLAMASSALPACLAPAWWAAHRTGVLAGVRLLVTLLFAAQALAAAQAATPAGAVLPVERALVSSGAAALAFLPVRFPLPFSMHLPLHLLCLWALTAASSVAHLSGSGPASAAWALLAQLVVGFLLSTALAYCRELRLRGSFLQARIAAASLGSPRQKVATAAAPVGPPASAAASKGC
ncbi:hypothetical protein ABPG75_007432 [Micractinium tetrahymenae]